MTEAGKVKFYSSSIFEEDVTGASEFNSLQITFFSINIRFVAVTFLGDSSDDSAGGVMLIQCVRQFLSYGLQLLL